MDAADDAAADVAAADESAVDTRSGGPCERSWDGADVDTEAVAKSAEGFWIEGFIEDEGDGFISCCEES